jgi:DNA-binding response OmpR family regulator
VIVEDDADIRNLLEAILTQAGFETHSASDGVGGVEAVRQHQPIVTTLDISLPDIDGFEVARRVRAFSDSYIVMLTARAEEIDTLMGLEAGADDYLTKPFRPRELRARIEAMLRRPRLIGQQDSEPAAATAPVETAPTTAPVPIETTAELDLPDWLVFDGLRLNPEMRLIEVDASPVDMTRSEFELLQTIMSARGRVVSKSTLALAMRPDDTSLDDYVSPSEKRTVEVHLANLRRKLGEDSASPRWIETVRGVGYRLRSAAQR